MLLVRPVEFADLPAIQQLAQEAGSTMTTLSSDRDHLCDLISTTQSALQQEVIEPAGETYHFVLEEHNTGEILGIAGINSAVGIKSPFYSYRLEEVVHASDDLQIHNRIPALKLCHDYTGYTCLCTLYIAQKFDSIEALQLLSRARLLFIALHRERFAERIMVELQGVTDDDGRSPFWESLGRHFFTMELDHANYLTGICDKNFIADLMPRYPVYTPLLSRKARSVIGEVRPDRIQVQDLLEQEGFSYEGYVDIFDAGPSMEACIDRLHTISESYTTTLKHVYEANDSCLITNNSTDNFRCTILQSKNRTSDKTASIADALRLDANNPVQVTTLFSQ